MSPKKYDTMIQIPVDRIEVFDQLEYIREARGLPYGDVHAVPVNEKKDSAGWKCATCGTVSQQAWGTSTVKRHEEAYGHLERVAARFAVSPDRLGRKLFCVLCDRWITDKRHPRRAEDHHRRVHGNAKPPTAEARRRAIRAWWKQNGKEVVVPRPETPPSPPLMPWEMTMTPPGYKDLDTQISEDFWEDEMARHDECRADDIRVFRSPFNHLNSEAMDVDHEYIDLTTAEVF